MNARRQGGTFGTLFARATTLFPKQEALVQGEVSLTYTELTDRTRRVGRLLSQLGVKPGAKVLLLFPNDYRLVECLFGTLQVGAVAVPLNIKMAADTLRYVATHSDA